MTPDTDHLRTFFTHEADSWVDYSKLERLLGLSIKTLRHWAKSKKRGLSEEVRPKVLAWAKARGYDENLQYENFL